MNRPPDKSVRILPLRVCCLLVSRGRARARAPPWLCLRGAHVMTSAMCRHARASSDGPRPARRPVSPPRQFAEGHRRSPRDGQQSQVRLLEQGPELEPLVAQLACRSRMTSESSASAPDRSPSSRSEEPELQTGLERVGHPPAQRAQHVEQLDGRRASPLAYARSPARRVSTLPERQARLSFPESPSSSR